VKRNHNAPLKQLNSLAVDVRANELIELESLADLEALTAEHRFDAVHDLVLGGGSNILFTADVPGCVIVNRLAGRKIISASDDEVLLEACSGENWHQLVLWSLAQGLSGLENLSLIPGLAGAAPIQNIGAYGVELSNVLDSVRTFDLTSGQYREFKCQDCHFGYRDSRFKSMDAGRYMITGIRLRLQRHFVPRLGYKGLHKELQDMGVREPTAMQVSNAVIRIRTRKLPDPFVTANAGSFFKNPVVSGTTARHLKNSFDALPTYPQSGETSKLSAAWMIEHCGWKGHREGDAGVSNRHALVLVNHGCASGMQILDLANRIIGSVRKRFDVELQIEPTIIGLYDR